MTAGEHDQKWLRLSANGYLDLARHMRMMVGRAASSEARSEYARLAVLYERLAARAARGPHAPDAPPLVPYKGIVRLPLQETYLPFTEEVINSRVPRAPGVYALWNRDCWIYVGATEDIQARLLQHHGGNEFGQERPTAFGFELIEDPVERTSRQEDLIRDLMPIC